MACPYFRPSTPFAPWRWPDRPRLPLVEPFDGVCEANPESWTPDESALRACCNPGYARGRCPRFPARSAFDAVRFTVRPQGVTLYILERDCAPAEYGDVGNLSGRLAAQAAAFRAAWSRRHEKEELP